MIAAIWKSASRAVRIRAARVRMLEAAGDELARSADYWQARAVAAEHERDELATRVRLYEMVEEDAVTQVDQSNAIAVLKASRDQLEQRFLQVENSIVNALGTWEGPWLNAAANAIRAQRMLRTVRANMARSAADELQLPPPSMEGL